MWTIIRGLLVGEDLGALRVRGFIITILNANN